MASAAAPSAGQLLLAHPVLRDPNFRRSIIFLAAHEEDEGTLGFILNRPTGQTLGDLAGEEVPEHLLGLPIYIGGPVSGQQIILARLSWNDLLDELELESNLDPDQIDLSDPAQLQSVRAFVGYSGWGKEQLSGELEEKTWIVHPPVAEAVTADTETWKKILRKLGPEFQLLVEMPDDPTLN